MKLIIALVTLLFGCVPYADLREYHYNRPQTPLQASLAPQTIILRESYAQPQATARQYAPTANTVVQNFGQTGTSHIARQLSAPAAAQGANGYLPPHYQNSNGASQAYYNQAGGNAATVAASYYPQQGQQQQQYHTPNINPLTQQQQQPRYVNLPQPQQQYSQQSYANFQQQQQQQYAGAGATYSGGNTGGAASYNTASVGGGVNAFQQYAGAGATYSGSNTGGGVGGGVNAFQQYAGAGATYSGGNTGGGGASYNSASVGGGVNAFQSVQQQHAGGVAHNGGNAGGVASNGAGVGGVAGAFGAATGQTALGPGLTLPLDGKYVSQSEAGQLRSYQHQQQPVGNTRPFSRQITNCYPNGQCERITLGPGQADQSHLHTVASTRAHTQPTSDKCRLIAEANKALVAYQYGRGYSYPGGNGGGAGGALGIGGANGQGQQDPNNALESAAPVRPKDRRLFPYSEVVVPRDPYN